MTIDITNYFAYPDLNHVFGIPMLQDIEGNNESKGRVAFVKTAVNMLDYLPVIGLICGIAKVALAGYACYKVFSEKDSLYIKHIDTTEKKVSLVLQGARGLVRSMGYRIALLIPDVFIGLGQWALKD